MKAAIAAVVLALCIPTACNAVDLPQTIQTKDGFTISLPADWVSIPKDALDQYSEAIAKLAPNAEKQTYDYGFQLPKKKYWLEYPYILVQVKRTGRVPEAQLKSLKRVEEQAKQRVGRDQEAFSAVFSNAQVGETVYESATHILWIQLTADVKMAGTVKAVLSSVLTEEGMIGIYCYAQAADFDKYVPLFEAIARKTVVADSLKYRPRWTDSLPLIGQFNWSRVLLAGIIGVICGGLLSGITTLFKARRKKKKDAGQNNGADFSS